MTHSRYSESTRAALFYTSLSSTFGDILLFWIEMPRAKIRRIFLPHEGAPDFQHARRAFPEAKPHVSDRHVPALITSAVESISSILSGTPRPFPIELLKESLSALPDFQQRVLSLEATIPFGYISTYGELAAAASSPKGARAAARVLSHNPFPILIPCHRVISSSGSLAGYQGGMEMKKQLLRQEGLPFIADRVDISTAHFWHFHA